MSSPNPAFVAAMVDQRRASYAEGVKELVAGYRRHLGEHDGDATCPHTTLAWELLTKVGPLNTAHYATAAIARCVELERINDELRAERQ